MLPLSSSLFKIDGGTGQEGGEQEESFHGGGIF